MVNAEKYKDIITTMIETNISDSAVKNGKPVLCSETYCKDCDLLHEGSANDRCTLKFFRWMLDDYKPNYRISEDLKERLSYKLLSFNEENFQEISRLILEAEVI